MASQYTEVFYKSEDGLKLFARDYSQPEGECLATLLCMHGLTRNSADFDELAQRYVQDYRVISMDQRGRGRSGYDPNPANYRPDIYCGDMFRLITVLRLENIIAIGTSMGGLMAMGMNALQPDVFKAVILNDIGPVVDPAGIDRIRSYVGAQGPFANWDEVVEVIKANNGPLFPGLSTSDWMQFAKQTCEQLPDGSVRFAYDKAISEGVTSADPTTLPPDLWALFDGLRAVPLLVIRGAMSDLLTRTTVDEMDSRHSNLQRVEIPNVGHAPMLNEEASVSAIQTFLDSLS